MKQTPKSPFDAPPDLAKKLQQDLAKAGCCGRNTALRKHNEQVALRRKLIPDR